MTRTNINSLAASAGPSLKDTWTAAIPLYMLRFARPTRSAALRSAFRRSCSLHVGVMTLNSPDNTTSKRKMVQIGTHNGTFHCDEALGCFLLQKTHRFKNAEVVRSRDQNVLKDLDIVIDVGGVYDPSTSFCCTRCRAAPCVDVRTPAWSQ